MLTLISEIIKTLLWIYTVGAKLATCDLWLDEDT